MSETEKALEKIREARLAYFASVEQKAEEPVEELRPSFIETTQKFIDDLLR